MISTYDGLLTVAQKAQIQTKKKPQIKKIKRNEKKENANEKKRMQIEKENANNTKT